VPTSELIDETNLLPTFLRGRREHVLGIQEGRELIDGRTWRVLTG